MAARTHWMTQLKEKQGESSRLKQESGVASFLLYGLFGGVGYWFNDEERSMPVNTSDRVLMPLSAYPGLDWLAMYLFSMGMGWDETYREGERESLGGAGHGS